MKNGKNNYGFLLIGMFALMLLVMTTFNTSGRVENINYTQLMHTLNNKDVKSIQVNKEGGVLVVEGAIKISDDPKAVYSEQRFKGFVPDTPEQYLELIAIANNAFKNKSEYVILDSINKNKRERNKIFRRL